MTDGTAYSACDMADMIRDRWHKTINVEVLKYVACGCNRGPNVCSVSIA